jgi:hypothetical protein
MIEPVWKLAAKRYVGFPMTPFIPGRVIGVVLRDPCSGIELEAWRLRNLA